MMGDDLKARIAVEEPGEHHPHHGHRGIVGPAEAPPHLEPGLLLRRVIRHAGGARRMQPDRKVELRHGGEDRLEGRIVERPACHAGENLHTAGAEFLHRAPRLFDRTLNVRHRQRGDERRKALGMTRTQFGHGVIADPRQVQADIAGRKVFDRRVRQRDDFAIIAELVHLAEALIEIEQLFDAPQPRRDIAQPRRNAAHLLGELLRHDVAIDVDDRVIGHGKPFLHSPSSCGAGIVNRCRHRTCDQAGRRRLQRRSVRRRP